MDILERIAVALERNNELLEASNAGRDAAIAAAKAASEKVAGTKKPAAETKADTKAETKPAATKADTKAAETNDDGPTVEDVNAAITAYVGASDRTEERDARKKRVRDMIAKYSPEGTEKPNGATLAVDKRGAFIKTTAKWLGEADLTTPPEPDASEDDDNLLDD